MAKLSMTFFPIDRWRFTNLLILYHLGFVLHINLLELATIK